MNNTDLKIEIGKKLSESFGISPKEYTYGIIPHMYALTPFSFLIILQGEWKESDLNNFNNDVTLKVAEINDIIDFVFNIKQCLFFDVAFDTALKPFDKYAPFAEENGLAFHLVMIDSKCIVQKQRIFSLTSTLSNQLIEVINKNIEKNINQHDFYQRVNRLYTEMQLNEIEKNSFLEYSTSKK